MTLMVRINHVYMIHKMCFCTSIDEFIPSGIAESHILQKDEAVVLQAQVEFIDETVPGGFVIYRSK